MEQWIFENLKRFFSYLHRVRLEGAEQIRLMDLYLPGVSAELGRGIREAVTETADYDRSRLSDEYFRAQQYGIGTEGRNAVIRARLAAVSEDGGREPEPPRESRARLQKPATLGQKYDRALFDYARGETAKAVETLRELAEKHYCLEAAENLLAYYGSSGDTAAAAGIFRLYRTVYRDWLCMNTPAWCADYEKVYAGGEDFRLPGYEPYDPEAPVHSKERFGFN